VIFLRNIFVGGRALILGGLALFPSLDGLKMVLAAK
jgi:hypothetical protein